MRLTLNWLKEYVDIDMEPEALARLLTMAGLEVEALEPLGRGLEQVVTARVASVERHPNADRLFVCRVDAGEGEVEVVCGAPNVREGMVTAYAPPGSRLPNGPAVKETRIRGRVSHGILLAEDEMGLTDDHSGVMELPGDLTPGSPVNRVLPLEDWALEIGLTPNRPDCTSVIGVAREVAALTGGTLRRPEIPSMEGDRSAIEEHTRVTVDDPQGCPRYSAGIVWKVEIGPSPFWMRYRLHSSGVRSINNVVDVTNFVL
ncbi:MAG: phenylalanine--tRNA ligase subunit beta, partial [Deltaproteobacteria bacterium]|nr:phenylalanine--tRNA ligase subunit beta [Deltaproteobacteria bacterium]